MLSPAETMMSTCAESESPGQRLNCLPQEKHEKGQVRPEKSSLIFATSSFGHWIRATYWQTWVAIKEDLSVNWNVTIYTNLCTRAWKTIPAKRCSSVPLSRWVEITLTHRQRHFLSCSLHVNFSFANTEHLQDRSQSRPALKGLFY